MANNITPEVKVEAQPFGILSPASTVIKAGDGAWETKLEYVDYSCVSDTELEGICIPGLTERVDSIPPEGTTPLKEYHPFSIETSFECSTMGMTPDEIEDRAEEALNRVRQTAIEKELWDGKLSQEIVKADPSIVNPYLGDSSVEDVSPGGDVDPKTALAYLEGVYQVSTIHCSRTVASMISSRIKQDGDVLRTKLGTAVIAGSGYSPEDKVMYATGPVLVVLGKPHVYPEDKNKKYEAVDISNNTVKFHASQTAAVVLGGCHKAKVNLKF